MNIIEKQNKVLNSFLSEIKNISDQQQEYNDLVEHLGIENIDMEFWMAGGTKVMFGLIQKSISIISIKNI